MMEEETKKKLLELLWLYLDGTRASDLVESFESVFTKGYVLECISGEMHNLAQCLQDEVRDESLTREEIVEQVGKYTEIIKQRHDLLVEVNEQM